MSVLDKISYTSNDFRTARSSFIQLAQKNFPQWTDFFESNNGIVFIELFAHALDILTFYQNNQANECFIDRVRQRKNMVSLTKLIGYELGSATASIVLVDFSSAAVLVNNLIIPGTNRETRTKLKTANGVIFEVLSDVTFSAGTKLLKNVFVKNVETKVFTVNAAGIPSQSIVLPVTPFLDDKSISVFIDSVQWAEVASFVNSTSTSKEYIVEVNDDDKGVITFGDSINGEIPPASAIIKVIYEVGGGIVGNVAPGTINSISGTLTDVLGNAIELFVTNLLPAVGGSEKETLDDARINAPASLRVLNRSISSDDFETNALSVSGVGRAKAIARSTVETEEVIGVGDGTTLSFTINLLAIPVKPTSILVRSDTVIGTDNGSGAITGTGIVSGTINYITGSINVVFTVAPSSGTSILATYIRDNSPDILPNHVFLYIVPAVGGDADTTMINNVKTAVTVTKPSMITVRVIVTSGKYKPINAVGRVTMEPGSDPAIVRNNINTELSNFFNPILKTNNVFDRDFGESIYPSQILCAVQNATGVLGVSLSSFNGVSLNINPEVSVTLNIEQLPQAGLIDLTLIDSLGRIISDYNINYESK